jgi:hypothetical protein
MALHYSGEASALADLAAQEKSPAARKRLREKEAELWARLRTITAQRDTLTTAGVRDRLKAVKKALEADTVNVVVTNQALRQAMSRMKARLEVYWHHSPETVQVINFHTRHKRWEAGSYGLSDFGPPEDTKASWMAMKQTAHTLSNAVRRAEKELQRPHENDALVIDVRPSDVETRIQLFQPRMLTHGRHLVDAKHVKKLSRT